MTTIREQVEAWPASIGFSAPRDSLRVTFVVIGGLEVRLRTTANALKERADAVDWLFACFPALTEVLTTKQITSLGRGASDARAVLARLEGLT